MKKLENNNNKLLNGNLTFQRTDILIGNYRSNVLIFFFFFRIVATEYLLYRKSVALGIKKKIKNSERGESPTFYDGKISNKVLTF